jgi:hypothetical protein
MATHKYYNSELPVFALFSKEELIEQHSLSAEDEETLNNLISDLGYINVELSEFPEDPYKYIHSGVVLVDGVYKTKILRVHEDYINKHLEYAANMAKTKRNSLLAESDWTQVADVPLVAEIKQQWASYRQQLRDITSQEKFPWQIVWPEKPQ